MITSESPATHSRSFFVGVNASFVGALAAGFVAGVRVGFELGLGVTLVGGTTIATSIWSASPLPMTSCTIPRGRSSRRAWLTWARPPVSASETSRLVPGWPLKAALCIPGAMRRTPKNNASSATTSAWPAVERRRPSSPCGTRRSRRAAFAHATLRGLPPRSLPAGLPAWNLAGGIPVVRLLVVRRPGGLRAPPTRGSAAASAARVDSWTASETEVDEGCHALGAHGVRQHEREREHQSLACDR